MDDNIKYMLEQLGKQKTERDRQLCLFNWIKCGTIGFKEHQELIKYLVIPNDKALTFRFSDWIKIKEELPPFDVQVLTWNEVDGIEPAKTDMLKAVVKNSKGITYEWYGNSYPTHWMKLPETPLDN